MAKFLSVADMSQIVLADSSQICHRAVVHICSISVSLVRAVKHPVKYTIHVKHPVKICVKNRCCYGNTNKSLLSLIKIERESLDHNNLP